jgi:hypothetical protein
MVPRPKGKPVRCRRGPATVTEAPLEATGSGPLIAVRSQGRATDLGSQIPAAEEEQTLSVERAHSALMSRGANSVRPGHGPAGE